MARDAALEAILSELREERIEVTLTLALSPCPAEVATRPVPSSVRGVADGTLGKGTLPHTAPAARKRLPNWMRPRFSETPQGALRDGLALEALPRFQVPEHSLAEA